MKRADNSDALVAAYVYASSDVVSEGSEAPCMSPTAAHEEQQPMSMYVIAPQTPRVNLYCHNDTLMR